MQETCERGSLCDGQVCGALAEVSLGGLLGPVRTVAEIDRVEVGGEDILLRVPAFVGYRESGLLGPAPGRDVAAPLLGDVEVLG